MAENTKTATLTDVARLAGVSIATASKAINGRAQVKASTRQRVFDAARELSFTPSSPDPGPVARTGTVGLLTSDLEGRFSIPIMMGAEDAFGVGATSVFLCDARGDAIREQHHIAALLSRRIDGIIVVGARPDPRRSLGRDIPVPVVYAYAPSDDPEDYSITSDNVQAGRLAAEHLLSIGRRKIAMVTGDPGYGASHDRVQGAMDVLAEAGVEAVDGKAHFGTWTESWGRGAAHVLFKAHPDIDAMICGSDQIARGAMDALREIDRDIPDDVAVIGHDNWEILATNARPTLTSIDMNLQELGRRAAARLFEAIDGHPSHGIEKLSCRLVPRGSTTPID
jgi:LacI family transcriptional regulator